MTHNKNTRDYRWDFILVGNTLSLIRGTEVIFDGVANVYEDYDVFENKVFSMRLRFDNGDRVHVLVNTDGMIFSSNASRQTKYERINTDHMKFYTARMPIIEYEYL